MEKATKALKAIQKLAAEPFRPPLSLHSPESNCEEPRPGEIKYP